MPRPVSCFSTVSEQNGDARDKVTNNSEKEGDKNGLSEHALSRRLFVGSTLVGIAGTVPSAVSAASGDTFTAVSDGNWNDPATWESGTVPTDGSDVSIQNGVTVTLDGETARLATINVEGKLRADPQIEAHVKVETLTVAMAGSLELGTGSAPVQSTVRVTFIDTGEFDYMSTDRGLKVMGDISVHGQEKTAWTPLAEHPVAGDTTIALPSEPTGWEVGDDVMLPGLAPNADEDERRTITAIDGGTVTLDSALSLDHVPPKSDLDSYVLNMTRTVVFESEADFWQRRGHVMVMSAESKFRYVAFDTLGRTNKNLIPTQDNPRGDENVPADATPNPRARYPLHWHRTGIGIDTPHYVEGAVVEDSPGWGIVNHHTYVDVVDSVTYDVDGAGFVSEGGNERGSFKRCFALRSTGSGETIDSRAFGDHGGDPAVDDFGHAGHGFWMQSPLVELTDNVAAGHRHQAFAWWLRPLLDEIEDTEAECSEVTDSRVAFCPNVPVEYADIDRPLWEAIKAGRFSTDEMDALMVDTQKIPSTFANLATVRANTAFASAGGVDFSRHNFKWKHERVSDFNTIDEMTVYNIGRFVDADGDVHEPNPPRHLDSGNQGRGGNVGVSFRYTSNVRLANSRLIGSGLENSFAVPFHDYRWTNTVDNCTIENWDWGVVTGEHRLTWVRNNVFRDNNYDVDWSFDNAGPAILDNNDLELVRNKFQYLNQKASEVFQFSQDRGMRVNGRTTYVEESAPDYVPFPDEDSLSGINNIESMDEVNDETNLVGLTNAEMQDQYGISIGGALLPDDAVSEPWIEGSLVDPAGGRSPPETVQLDATDSDSLGAWEAVSNPDASGGNCLRWTGNGDGPASISFDCAAGTYTIEGRIQPDSWNGDIVSFRIDGGDWKDAEKLKTPAGFKWHDVEPNGGDKYEWALSEGTHTLEFAADDDGALIDEIFISSNAEVVGAFGDASTATEDVFSISTEATTNVGETSATLNGSLTDLGGASSADCHFEWRQVGASSWSSTAKQTLSSAGSYNADVDGLDDEVEYEYRAVGEASDGDTDTGSTLSFALSDDPPAVTTGSASNVGTDNATLDGSLDDLGNADSADVYFEYRQTGASSWTATANQTLTSTGTFSEDVTGLTSGAEYEFRAAADGSDGDTGTGVTVSFSTDSSTSDSAPAIDSYSVSEAGSPNPHAEITADWSVSDADGNLDTVEVDVFDSSGRLVDSATTTVSGSSASGTDKFKIKHVDGQTFDVTLTVTDTKRDSSSETRTVTS